MNASDDINIRVMKEDNYLKKWNDKIVAIFFDDWKGSVLSITIFKWKGSNSTTEFDYADCIKMVRTMVNYRVQFNWEAAGTSVVEVLSYTRCKGLQHE